MLEHGSGQSVVLLGFVTVHFITHYEHLRIFLCGITGCVLEGALSIIGSHSMFGETRNI